MLKKMILSFLFFSKKKFFLEESNIKYFLLVNFIGGMLLNFSTLSLLIMGIFSLIYIKNLMVEVKKNYQINFFNIYLSGFMFSMICLGLMLVYWVNFINEDFFMSCVFNFFESDWLVFLKVFMSCFFLYKMFFSKCGC